MIILLAGVSLVKSDSVCTLKTLRMEIREDLADNGMLDCLRKINVPHNYVETELEKNARIMAQWDSSCSFETSTNYKEILKNEFNISTLVDSNGEPVSQDFEDQVDLCEIIRASIANGDFGNNIQMRKIPEDVVNKIDCSGPLGDRDGPKICAATSGSFYNKTAWNIFLKSSAITLAGKPTFSQKQIEEENDNQEQSLSEKMKSLLNNTKDRFAGLTGKLYNKIKGSASSVQVVNESDIHFFKLHDNQITLSNTPNKFKRIDSNAVELNGMHNGQSYSMFAFYMISTDETGPNTCEFRMNLNGSQVSETRANLFGNKNASVSSATISNIANSVNTNMITLEYRSDRDIPIHLAGNTGSSSFAVESILWPQTNIFKFVNSQDFQINNTEGFTEMVDGKNPSNNKIELFVKNDKQEARDYIITYNVAAKLTEEVKKFGTVLKNKNEIIWNTVHFSNGKSLANHAAKVVTIPAGEDKTFSLEYELVGDSAGSIDLKNDITSNAVVALNAIELPKIAKYEIFEPTENVVLTGSNNSFKPLHVMATKAYTEKTKVMILYHANIKMAKGTEFIFKLIVNDAKSQRSIMSFMNNEYASGQGYVLHEFDKGNYDIQLMYYGKGDYDLNAKNVGVEMQEGPRNAVEMTIIEFN
jgi:hypothetical protein